MTNTLIALILFGPIAIAAGMLYWKTSLFKKAKEEKDKEDKKEITEAVKKPDEKDKKKEAEKKVEKKAINPFLQNLALLALLVIILRYQKLYPQRTENTQTQQPVSVKTPDVVTNYYVITRGHEVAIPTPVCRSEKLRVMSKATFLVRNPKNGSSAYMGPSTGDAPVGISDTLMVSLITGGESETIARDVVY